MKLVMFSGIHKCSDKTQTPFLGHELTFQSAPLLCKTLKELKTNTNGLRVLLWIFTFSEHKPRNATTGNVENLSFLFMGLVS